MTKADLRKLVVEGIQDCLTEGMLDNMMKGAKPVQLPPHLHEKLLGMGNVLAGGYQDQVSDDIKIVAAIMYYSSGNKETNIFDTVTSFHQKGIKENFEGEPFEDPQGMAGPETVMDKLEDLMDDAKLNERERMIIQQRAGGETYQNIGKKFNATKERIRSIEARAIRKIRVVQMRKHPELFKENTMKRSELKGLIKEVVRQCVKEAGPQYKVRDGRSYVEQPGKVNRARDIQDTPEVNENSGYKLCRGCEEEYEASDLKRGLCPGCRHDQGRDDDVTDHSIYKEPSGRERQPGDPSHWPGDLDEDANYEEQDEIRLIKAVGKAIVKLLQMHKGMEEPEGEEPEVDGEKSDAPPFPPKKEKKPTADKAEGELDEGGPQYKVRDGRSYVEKTGQINRAREIQSDPNVNESNHKVQHRSYKTINDVPQNPENLRDPEVPQA